MPTLVDYVDVEIGAARAQWAKVLTRPPRPSDPRFRQVTFLPVETLLCLAASLLVNHRGFGGSSSHRAGTPVPELARLFGRTPASILAKMANLDGSRPNGARHEVEAAATLLADPGRLMVAYGVIMVAARGAGIDVSALPDFLGEDLQLLGQEELSDRDVEAAVEPRLAALSKQMAHVPPGITSRLLMAAARIGQHRFAGAVLANCGHQCVFCGLAPGASLAGRRLLLASHIKPWRDSTDGERLDPTNGLAACPSHDAAFDTGLLWVNGGLRVHAAAALATAAAGNPGLARTFGPSTVHERLALPSGALPPGDGYLAWHREFIAAA